MMERRCEGVVLDEHDRGVPCGRIAVERVHDWWLCDECRVEAAAAQGAQAVECEACPQCAA